ncbi:MAG TPA: band-7 C-terminal domain-containing protein [Burkholderiales bacterium]|nr:band-7 C-terminal domain-containing protein [Burkholderiales bacterium]
MKVAQQYVEALANLAKQSKTLIIPGNAADAGGFFATAMAVLHNARVAKGPAAA